MSRKPTAEQLTQPAPETDDLMERIERLEQRLDHSILGDDGVAELDKGIDKSGAGDPLQRAVQRSNVKRGSRKA
ncbi:MAG: hypothetical protein NTV73_11500 [Hyphomicrobiales bacterium]|nr:hypothetical protein [Hyphomicrobiales bacterium]